MLIVTRKTKLLSHVINLPLILQIQTIPIIPPFLLKHSGCSYLCFRLDQSCYLKSNVGNISQSKNEKHLIYYWKLQHERKRKN